jgi:hypothetical protein
MVKYAQNDYELEQAQHRLKTLQQLEEEGVTYFITNEFFYKPYFEISSNRFPFVIKKRIDEVQAFYQYFMQTHRPVMVFQPDFWTKGPEIRIYSIGKRAIEK